MVNQNPEETYHIRSFCEKVRKRKRTIEFLAVVIGMIAAITYLFESFVQRPELCAEPVVSIANLVAQNKPDITSSAIKKELEIMHEKKCPVTGIEIPNVKIRMSNFEGVDWQNITMNGGDFACNNETYDKIRSWRKGEPVIDFCVRLKKADFSHSCYVT